MHRLAWPSSVESFPEMNLNLKKRNKKNHTSIDTTFEHHRRVAFGPIILLNSTSHYTIQYSTSSKPHNILLNESISTKNYQEPWQPQRMNHQ
jgi:hypothetical protein